MLYASYLPNGKQLAEFLYFLQSGLIFANICSILSTPDAELSLTASCRILRQINFTKFISEYPAQSIIANLHSQRLKASANSSYS